MPHDPIAAPGAVDRWSAQLLDQGYIVIPDLVPRARIAALDADLTDDFADTPFCEGPFYGRLTKRFGRLLARSDRTAALVQHKLILGITERILQPYCDVIQLNLTQAIALHPGALPQLPHRDQDMWRGETGRVEYLVNVMWPFTDYHAGNGATLIWPCSHGANAARPEPTCAPVIAAMRPGSALIFLGSTLHGAGGNESNAVRRGMITSYCLGWLKPYENQWLAYPPPVARRFSPELAALVGYRQHRPNLGNFEGRCPSILLGDDPDGAIGAVDALRQDQEVLVEAFAAGQQR
ncbi:phytanoyl-CoA dioxygenase family protein [Sphingomonas sp. So64.6b]|uniref:phytanoyl-CoA dioxygenase family protein n=1 Tax=Sphingomonas sp. So64.6b TaxID=2997354 RepID=UPI0015FF7B8F|nr:phytanoyl-CoA dioxygenase family protein [Sphingomonas sp. So64.6b]QNA83757.1 phytanoyl-CoA dioxygenase family protein [Sphingomonas sp. So64.6b]